MRSQLMGKGAPGKHQRNLLVFYPAFIHLPEFAGSAPRAWVQLAASCQKIVKMIGHLLRGGFEPRLFLLFALSRSRSFSPPFKQFVIRATDDHRAGVPGPKTL